MFHFFLQIFTELDHSVTRAVILFTLHIEVAIDVLLKGDEHDIDNKKVINFQFQ